MACVVAVAALWPAANSAPAAQAGLEYEIEITVGPPGEQTFNEHISLPEALENIDTSETMSLLYAAQPGTPAYSNEAKVSGISLALIAELAGVNPLTLSYVTVSKANDGGGVRVSGEEVNEGFPSAANPQDSPEPPFALIEVSEAGSERFIRPSKKPEEANGTEGEVIGFPLRVTLAPYHGVLELVGKPTFHEAANGDLVFEPPEVKFHGVPVPATDLEYRWRFGDGAESTGPKATHHYQTTEPTPYAVKLLVVDPAQEEAEATKVLHLTYTPPVAPAPTTTTPQTPANTPTTPAPQTATPNPPAEPPKPSGPTGPGEVTNVGSQIGSKGGGEKAQGGGHGGRGPKPGKHRGEGERGGGEGGNTSDESLVLSPEDENGSVEEGSSSGVVTPSSQPTQGPPQQEPVKHRVKEPPPKPEPVPGLMGVAINGLAKVKVSSASQTATERLRSTPFLRTGKSSSSQGGFGWVELIVGIAALIAILTLGGVMELRPPLRYLRLVLR